MIIRRISPTSCARIAGAVYAIFGLLAGAMFSLVGLASSMARENAEGAAFGMLFGVGAIVVLPALYGVLGFVMTWITVWLYNVLAGTLGGVEIEVQ